MLWQVYYFPGKPGRFMTCWEANSESDSNCETFFGKLPIFKANMKMHSQSILLLQCHNFEWDGIFNEDGTCVIFILMFLYFISRYFLLVFEEPEDPSNRSFFSEIISSVSDVKFSHSGRYLMTRDYLTVKVWDLNMESKPLETYQVWLWVI